MKSVFALPRGAGGRPVKRDATKVENRERGKKRKVREGGGRRT